MIGRWGWGGVLTLGLMGCGRLPASVSPPPSPNLDLQPPNLEAFETTKTEQISLQVQDPADLQVQVGDFVIKGQVLSDRQALRQDLERRRQELQIQLRTLTASAQPPRMSRTSQILLEEERERAEAQVQQATQALKQAEAALADFLDQLPWTDYALENLPLPAEQLQLEALQANLSTAQANLQRAKEQQQQIATAVNTPPSGEPPTHAGAELEKQLAEIASQLEQLQPVVSPHAGTITDVQIAGQPPKVQVKLTLEVESLALPLSIR